MASTLAACAGLTRILVAIERRASIFSGRLGVHNGVATHWGPGSEFRWRDDIPMLARHLLEHGHYTASVSSFADRHAAWWFCVGWREHHSHTLKRGNETADEVNAAALPVLKRLCHLDDWFVHIQYWDPHRDYRTPDDWLYRFKDEPPPPWPDAEAIASHQDTAGPFTAAELQPFRERPRLPHSIANVDRWLRRGNRILGPLRRPSAGSPGIGRGAGQRVRGRHVGPRRASGGAGGVWGSRECL